MLFRSLPRQSPQAPFANRGSSANGGSSRRNSNPRDRSRINLNRLTDQRFAPRPSPLNPSALFMIRPNPEVMKHTNRLPVASSEGAPASDIGQGAGATLEESLDRLAFGKQRLAKLSIGQRIELLRQCIHGIRSPARAWVEQACAANGIPAGSPARPHTAISSAYLLGLPAARASAPIPFLTSTRCPSTSPPASAPNGTRTSSGCSKCRGWGW